MNPESLGQELARLTDRLSRIERHLGIDSPESADDTQIVDTDLAESRPDEVQAHQSLGVEQERAGEKEDERVVPPGPAEVGGDEPSIDEVAGAAGTISEAFPAPSPDRPRRPAPRSGKAPKPKASLEMIVGGNWAAWVGAAILFLAALFAIKIAVDNGWWGMLSPLAKFLVIAGCGALFTVGGEVVLRKIGRKASIGLYSAGLSILYLDAFATFRYWDLFPREWAFVLMGVVAVGGFALTYRTKSLSIGVFSIVGGFLTPVLLHGQSTHDLEVLSYLTLLLAISLGLAATHPKPFERLRFVALTGLSIVGLGWLVSNGPAHWMLGIVFMSIWWTMILAQAVLAALRDHSTRGNIVMTLLATAAFSTAGTWILSAGPTAGTDWIGVFTAMVGGLAAATAFQFGPGIDGLRVFPRRAIDKLSVALWVQAAILLTTAVALHFDDAGRAVGWLVIGIGAIETGRRLPSRGLDIFGLVVGGLALLDVALVSWWASPVLADTIYEAGAFHLTGWSVLALGAIAATWAGAVRINSRWPSNWKIAPIVLATIGTIGWLGWWLVQADGPLITAGWLAGAGMLLAAQRWATRQRAFELAQLVTLAAAVRWATIDLASDRFASGWDPAASLPLVNERTALALLIGVVGWWIHRIYRRRQQAEAATGWWLQLAGQAAVLFIVAVGLVALSFDIDRIVERLAGADRAVEWVIGHVRQNALTALWGVGALTIAILGLLVERPLALGGPRSPRLLSTASMLITVLCVVKWIAADTLAWAVTKPDATSTSLLPIANVQLLTGFVLAITGPVVFRLLLRRARTSASDPAGWLPVVSSVVLLWGLSFETDRIIDLMENRQSLTYDPVLLRALAWTALWSAGGLVMMVVGRWRMLWKMLPAGSLLIAAGALFWMTFDTLSWRLLHPALDVPVVLNVQFAVGAGLAVMLIAAGRIIKSCGPERASDLYKGANPGVVVPSLIALLALWLGTLELDRFFRDDPTVWQVSFSVYWGLFGIMLIAVGFLRASAIARYAGLILLAITAGKVIILDMSGIENIWRVVSAAATGLLLVGTSVAYAKLGTGLQSGGGRRPESSDTEV